MHTMLNTRRAQMLFAMGLCPKLTGFWILYHSVDIVRENPQCIQAMRCQLYPEISTRVDCTADAIESALRRICKSLEAGQCKRLRAYLPAGTGPRPKPKELLSAWLLMAEVQENRPDGDSGCNADEPEL